LHTAFFITRWEVIMRKVWLIVLALCVALSFALASFSGSLLAQEEKAPEKGKKEAETPVKDKKEAEAPEKGKKEAEAPGKTEAEGEKKGAEEKGGEEPKKPGLAQEFKKIQAMMRKPLPQRTREAYEARKAEVKKAAEELLAKYEAKTVEGEDLYWMGRALAIAERFDDAGARFKTFIEKNPDSSKRKDAFLFLIHIYYRDQKYEEANKLIDSCLEQYGKEIPKRHPLWRMKGRIASALKRGGLEGKPAPSLEIEAWIGEQNLTLETLKGKVVLIDFWATWCGPCLRVIPHLVELYEKHKDRGLMVLGATRLYKAVRFQGQMKRNLSKEEELKLLKEFAKEYKITYPIVITAKNVSGQKYFVTGIPTVFLVDRKGNIRFHQVGAGSHEKLDAELEKLLEEKE
jgi:thiol-disulfide isomerase/thioredoxin